MNGSPNLHETADTNAGLRPILRPAAPGMIVSAVIVGASGAVGKLLVPYWNKEAAPVLLQYRGITPPWEMGNCLQWNPAEGPAALKRWVAAHAPPPCLIVLAGVKPFGQRDLSLNASVVEKCLSAAHEIGMRRALVASSSAVYGNHLDRGFREEDETRPVTAYGKAKLDMERFCRRQVAPEMELTYLRIGNVAGADSLLSQVIAGRAEPLVIDRFADGGTPLRSYIGPGTLAELLLQLAGFPGRLPEILNVGTPDPVEMGALADAAGLCWNPRPQSDARHQRITLDCGRLWSLLPGQAGASDPAAIVRQLGLGKKPA